MPNYSCKIERDYKPPAVCGDLKVEAPEQCDDGNDVGGDGCSTTCTTEPVVAQESSVAMQGGMGLCMSLVAAPAAENM